MELVFMPLKHLRPVAVNDNAYSMLIQKKTEMIQKSKHFVSFSKVIVELCKNEKSEVVLPQIIPQ